MNLMDELKTLTDKADYLELKYRASGRRPAYWYCYASTPSTPTLDSLEIEADGYHLEAVLEAVLEEIKQEGQHTNHNGYIYIQV